MVRCHDVGRTRTRTRHCARRSARSPRSGRRHPRRPRGSTEPRSTTPGREIPRIENSRRGPRCASTLRATQAVLRRFLEPGRCRSTPHTDQLEVDEIVASVDSRGGVRSTSRGDRAFTRWPEPRSSPGRHTALTPNRNDRPDTRGRTAPTTTRTCPAPIRPAVLAASHGSHSTSGPTEPSEENPAQASPNSSSVAVHGSIRRSATSATSRSKAGPVPISRARASSRSARIRCSSSTSRSDRRCRS